nr:hypothetical protein [Mimivirus sp.]
MTSILENKVVIILISMIWGFGLALFLEKHVKMINVLLLKHLLYLTNQVVLFMTTRLISVMYYKNIHHLAHIKLNIISNILFMQIITWNTSLISIYNKKIGYYINSMSSNIILMILIFIILAIVLYFFIKILEVVNQLKIIRKQRV